MLKLILKQMYRRPKYPLVAGIGIMIAVSLIVGTNIAIDNLVGIEFKNELNKIPVDFVIDKEVNAPMQLPNINRIKNQLFKVKEIKNIEVAWHFHIPNQILSQKSIAGNEEDFDNILKNITEDDVISFTLLGVPSDFGKNVSGITWLSGNINTTQKNSIAIPKSFADEYNLTVGDDFYLVSLHKTFNITTLNFTFLIYSIKLHITGIFVFNQTFQDLFYSLEGNHIIFLTSFSNAYQISVRLTTDYVNNIITKQSSERMHISMSTSSELPSFPAATNTYRIYVFLDRDAVYKVWTLNNVDKKIDIIKNKIYVQLFMDSSYKIKFVASYAINRLKNWTEETKYQLGIFYVPIIIIGTFLSVASINATLENRKKELDILATRGTTESQIKQILIIEGVFIGIISSCLGVILANFFGYTATLMAADKLHIKSSEITYSIPLNFDVLYGFVVGIALALFSAFLVARNIKYVGTNEKRNEEHTDKVKKITSRRLKLLVVGEIVSVYKIISLLLNFSSLSLLYSINEMNFLLMLFVYMFVFVDLIILGPIAPFLFIYCTIRLAFIYMDKVLAKASSMVKYLTKTTLSKIALSDALRHPKRYMMVSFVLSLAISFGVMIPIIHASQVQYQVRIIKVYNGADIHISEISSATKREISELSDKLNVTGVTNFTFIYYVNIELESGPFASLAINPDKYTSIVKDNIAENFSQHGLMNTLQKMKSNITYAMATEDFLRAANKEVGDTVDVSIAVNKTYTTKLKVKIIDTVFILPGVNPTNNAEMGVLLADKLILNSELLKNNSIIDTANFTRAMITYILVDTATEDDAIRVGQYLRNTFRYADVRITKEEVDSLLENPLITTIYNILDIEYFLIFFVATIGIGFVLLTEITERKREFAIMMARGASEKQLFILILKELLILSGASIIAGIITGYLAGAAYIAYITGGNNIIASFTHLRGLTPKIIIPSQVYYVILGSSLSILAVMVIPMYTLRRINIRSLLQSEI